MLGPNEQPLNSNILFKKGMTLDQYLSQMQTLRPSQQQDEKLEEDLYATSKKNQASLSKKIITYQIRQSQEDDYEQSQQQTNFNNVQVSMTKDLANKQHRMSNKNILINFPGTEVKASLQNSRGFRVRKQSNSPFNHHKKDSTVISPNKNFAMTLFNTDWKNNKEVHPRSGNPSTTLYGKFLKGVKQMDQHKQKHHSKQKYFQKKNTQQMQYVLKYEKDIQQKYNKINLPDTLDMRVEGVTDRLHDRKIASLKGHK